MKRLAVTAILGVFTAGAAFISSAPADTGGCQPSQLSSPPPQPDQLGHPLNYVLVENCQAGGKALDSKLSVVRASGQGEQPTNVAYAYSQGCAPGCESIAVAYQIVLVAKDSPTQSPQNGAVALNDNCTGCATFAYADQYAVDVPAGTRLTGAARRALDQIGREAAQDIRANLSFPELDSRLKALAVQVKDVVDDGLQQEHVAEAHRHNSQHETQTGEPGSGTTTRSGTTSTTSPTTSSTTTSSSTTTTTSSSSTTTTTTTTSPTSTTTSTTT